MTDEQMATLREMAERAESSRDFTLDNIKALSSDEVTSWEAQVWAELEGRHIARHGRNADALRAALTLAEQTCGTCKHWEQWPTQLSGRCRNAGSMAWAMETTGRESPPTTNVSDGCRIGWRAR